MVKEFFNKTYCLEVWGDFACFTRPEMKVERVSYDVITPSAARAIFEAIFWKPAIRWQVKKIEVLNPIRWINLRRNELSILASSQSGGIFIDDIGNDGKPKYRQQRAGYFLKDVKYRLYAELIFIPVEKRKSVQNPVPEFLTDHNETSLIKECDETEKTGKDENPGKYNAIFERRARKGQCFNQPFLGCREFSANFKLIDETELEKEQRKNPPLEDVRDLGFMLYDMDFTDASDPKAAFFRANMIKGAIDVPDWNSEEVRR